MTPFSFFYTRLKGYQVSLKSTRGPIDVFLCPEDSSGVCSPVTGSSPSKPDADPALTPPTAQLTDQSQAKTSAAEVRLASPASTLSTVTAASQQDPSSLVLGGDSGEDSQFLNAQFMESLSKKKINGPAALYIEELNHISV